MRFFIRNLVLSNKIDTKSTINYFIKKNNIIKNDISSNNEYIILRSKTFKILNNLPLLGATESHSKP